MNEARAWQETIVVFAPHPDDETLGCGGTIAKKFEEGFNVYVVFMTDGRNSHLSTLGITSKPSPEELIWIRRNEANKACKHLGLNADSLLFLNFEDGSLEKKIECAKQKVSKILEELNVVECFFPHETDLHHDHLATSIIVKESVRMLKITPRLYQYIIWAPRLHRHMLLDPRKYQHVLLNPKANDKTATEKLVKIDISSYLPRKKMALEEYKSQISIFSKNQQSTILSKSFIKHFLKSYETFWLGNPK